MPPDQNDSRCHFLLSSLSSSPEKRCVSVCVRSNDRRTRTREWERECGGKKESIDNFSHAIKFYSERKRKSMALETQHSTLEEPLASNAEWVHESSAQVGWFSTRIDRSPDSSFAMINLLSHPRRCHCWDWMSRVNKRLPASHTHTPCPLLRFSSHRTVRSRHDAYYEKGLPVDDVRSNNEHFLVTRTQMCACVLSGRLDKRKEISSCIADSLDQHEMITSEENLLSTQWIYLDQTISYQFSSNISFTFGASLQLMQCNPIDLRLLGRNQIVSRTYRSDQLLPIDRKEQLASDRIQWQHRSPVGFS